MTTYNRATEQQRQKIKGILLNAMRISSEIVSDRAIDDGLVLHPAKTRSYRGYTLPYVTDSEGHVYYLGPTGRLTVGRN